MPKNLATDLLSDKLESSGLTLKDAQILNIVYLSPTEVQALRLSTSGSASSAATPAMKFNYHHPDGSPLSDWPGAKPFYRLRYLGKQIGFQAQSKKPLRYVQEANTMPVAYYPQNYSWSTLSDDQPILITEGELKAAKACKEGFPCIGLGGVYNYRSYANGIDWLPSLDFISWLRRNVYIVFDSDYKTNPNVALALKALCDELQFQGAIPYVVTLPRVDLLAGDSEKTGLDDFLVATGPDALKELLSTAEPIGVSQPLWDLNHKYAYVEDPGLIIDQRTGFKVTPTAFRDHLQAPARYFKRTIRKDGSFGYEQVSAAAIWLKWPHRTQVAKMSYQPGKETFPPDRTFNIWTGWGVEPSPGDYGPFARLVEHLFSTTSREDMEWFLDWCAYPLQNPGVKVFSSAVLFGVKHGTGKSLVGYTLGRIYGVNFTELKQRDLHTDFNEWAIAKQFVLGDDITGSNKRADADILKKTITQREMRVNPKYIPSYVVRDCINYIFTSNQPDAFFLEDDDRRFFIHEVQVAPLDELFYAEYDLWLDTGGSAAVFDWLLRRDLSNFNPAAPARRTMAKERMTADVRSDLGAWVRDLLSNPDYNLRVGNVRLKKDIYTNKELLMLYDPTGHTGTTGNGLGRELGRAGVKKVMDGKPIRLPDGAQDRYYIIRNPEKWVRENLNNIIQHICEKSK